jgi:hypothetical protein
MALEGTSMPAKTPTINKATSPSKVIQQAIDKSWGKQKATTSIPQALSTSPNKQTVNIKGTK